MNDRLGRRSLFGRNYGSYVAKEYKFFVYVHSLPDGTPFYVGRGSLYRAFRVKHSRNRLHGEIVARIGADNIRVSLIDCDTPEETSDWEKRLIAEYSERHELANLSTGGQGSTGYKHTPQARANMAASRRGVKWSDERRKKHSLLLLGRVQTDATREKMRQAWTPERRATLSKTMSGGNCPSKRPEVRIKMSLAQKGRENPAGKRRKGYVFIHQSNVTRVVPKTEFDELIALGWRPGMAPRHAS